MKRWSPTLAPLALMACWPYIPGRFTDYEGEGETGIEADTDTDADTDSDTDADTDADTDTDTDADTDTDTDTEPPGVRMVGEVNYLDYLGEYWEGGSPASEASGYWGWLSSPDTSFGWAAGLHPGGVNTCVSDPDYGPLVTLFYSSGSGASAITSGTQTVYFPWDSSWREFRAESLTASLAESGDTLYIGDTNIAGHTVKVNAWVTVPSSITFSGPDMDVEYPGYAAPADLSWTWSSVPTGVDYVRLSAYQVDSEGALSKGMSCLVPSATKRVSIPASSWSDPDGFYWIIELATIREETRTIQGMQPQESVGWGIYTLAGVLFQE